MKLDIIKHLLGLQAQGVSNRHIEQKLKSESRKLQEQFLQWERELNNFLDYADCILVSPEKEVAKRELFYRGLDSIDAGEILIAEFGAYNKQYYI